MGTGSPLSLTVSRERGSGGDIVYIVFSMVCWYGAEGGCVQGDKVV